MIDVYRKDLQESSLSGSRDCVSSVVRVGPRIGPVREATVSKVVYDALIRVLFRAHEDQAGGAGVRCKDTRSKRVLTAPGYEDSQSH